MAAPVNTTANSSDIVAGLKPNIWGEKKTLAHATAIRMIDQFAMEFELPENEGTEVEMRRVKPFTAVTTPLTEGVTPTATKLNYEYVKMAIKQYGQVLEMSDRLVIHHKNPYYRDGIRMSGENAGRTFESIDWGVLTGGTAVAYANGTTRAGVNSEVTRSKLSMVRSALNAQKAMPVTRMLKPGTGVDTMPIGASYIAFCHTDVLPSLEAIPNENNSKGFVPIQHYGTFERVSKYERGSALEIRFLMSPDLEPIKGAGAPVGNTGMKGTTPAGQTAARCDIYPIVIFGMEAYGGVKIRGKNRLKHYAHPAEKATKSDPLGQKAIVGWKADYVTGICNQLWIYRLEVAVKEQ